MKVAVIGAGIHGAATALSLSKRGHAVTIIDRDTPANKNGSSHGRSRIIRKAYSDPFYARIMGEAYPMWDEWVKLSSEPLIYKTGILCFGEADSPDLMAIQATLNSESVAFDILSPNEVPSFRLTDSEIGVFSTDGGWVNAEQAVLLAINSAIALGTVFLQRESPQIQELERDFGAFVLAPGSSIRDTIDLPIEVRVQTLAYIRHKMDGPVWIESGPNFLYGFPSAEGENTFKIGVHNRGRVWKSGEPRPGIDEESIELIRDFARKRLGIDKPVIDEVITCLYTMLPNEDFRWGRIGANGFWVSACSGHGFKFGPWIGEQMADFVDGVSEPSKIERFYA